MGLPAGTQLGPYEILSAIGAGGMGEVYRATDTRLGRDVALKVLREEFAGDVERMARFEREAKVLASLNHPNIASIHGLEESDSKRGTQHTFAASAPRLLADTPIQTVAYSQGNGDMDVSPDGQRFLVVKARDEKTASAEVRVVLNWSEELKRLTPTGTQP